MRTWRADAEKARRWAWAKAFLAANMMDVMECERRWTGLTMQMGRGQLREREICDESIGASPPVLPAVVGATELSGPPVNSESTTPPARPCCAHDAAKFPSM